MKSFFNFRWVRIYVIPGAVFQSVMVGGGYGTGREIVEYFTSYGVLGGVLSLVVAYLTMAVVLALTFELSRLSRAYDYRNFFKQLLGKAWIAYEVLMILMFLLILAVLASAAGNILRDNMNIPYFAGIVFMLLIIGVLTFYGRELIAKALTLWSIFLYAVFISFFIIVFGANGDVILEQFRASQIFDGWTTSGFKYAVYNLSALPLLLYIARGFESRAEASVSGLIAAAIALVPGLLFHLSFSTAYPQVIEQPIPVYWLMADLGMSVLVVFYTIMLFGTFIETGAGMLQGINERVDAYLTESKRSSLPGWAHASIAVSAVSISATLSLIGITRLIAQGYGAMAWAFLAIYVVPLITIGLYRIVKSNRW